MNATQAARAVRLYVAVQTNVLSASIRQVCATLLDESTLVCVERAEEADLIIFNEPRDVERGYNMEKSYVFLKSHSERSPSFSNNCTVLEVGNFVVGLLEVVDGVRQKLNPLIDDVVPVEPVSVPLRPDALSILVIDDTARHIESAKSGLAGHRLTTVTGYEEAMETLAREKFDVVLTDLHLPMSSKTMGSKFVLGALVPYGVLLMVEAARQGAKHVAVVTDLNHHDDPFSAAFDHYSQFSVKIDGAKVVMMHAPMNDGSKDWAHALARLLEK